MYFLLLAISSSFLISEDISGYDLAKMIDEKKQPKTSKSEISMTLMDISKNRNKTKNIISISKDDGNKMLMFFKSPKRDKGVSFLKISAKLIFAKLFNEGTSLLTNSAALKIKPNLSICSLHSLSI